MEIFKNISFAADMKKYFCIPCNEKQICRVNRNIFSIFLINNKTKMSMQKLTTRILTLAISIVSIAAVGCSKKVDSSLPQTISLSTNGAKADGFSIKTSNDFFVTPDDQRFTGFDGVLFNQKTGADTVVLEYAYGSEVSSNNLLPNASDKEIKDSYSGFDVTNIDRTTIGNCKSSIMVTYEDGNAMFVDVYLYTANLAKSATMLTGRSTFGTSFPLSATQLKAVQDMYRSFRFINQ